MEEVQVNDYIRTVKGTISKITEIAVGIKDVKDTLYFTEKYEYYHCNEIVKHSKNIIDLIEIGDYVNGYSIDNIVNGVLVHRANGIDRSGYLIPIVQYENDIKSIVTKEQFASLEYRI